MDANGNLKTIPDGGPSTGVNGAACAASSFPWSQGGNSNPPNSRIGTCTMQDFVLMSNSNEAIFLKTNGHVGVGLNNSSPQAALDVSDGSLGTSSGHLKILGDDMGTVESSGHMSLVFQAGGFFTLNDATTPNGTQFTMQDGVVGIGGPGIPNIGAKLDVYGRTRAVTSSNSQEMLSVFNSPANFSKFSVYGSGKTNIGENAYGANSAQLNINVSSATAYAFDVYNTSTGATEFRVKNNGFAYAREINVMLGNFPDYVFKKDYPLMPLEHLELFIQKNHHLPNVPTAAEIEQNGGNLGELSRIQMEKIEELTLYVIGLKKEVEALKAQASKK